MTIRSDPWPLKSPRSGILADGRWFWLRAVAWTTLLFVGAVGAFFATLQLTSWAPVLQGHGTLVALLVPAATVVVYALLVRLIERRSAIEFQWSRAASELLVGALVGFVFIASASLLLWLLGLNEVTRGTWHDAWHSFVFNAYISAVLEELAFRAILLRLFARMFGVWPGLALSSLLFGLAHAGHASPVAVAELVVNGGGVLGLMYVVSGRLWLSIGAHVAYDFTEWSLMGVGNDDGLLLARPVADYPDWLTGGSFGPDGSVLAVLVGAFILWAILAVHRRLAA